MYDLSLKVDRIYRSAIARLEIQLGLKRPIGPVWMDLLEFLEGPEAYCGFCHSEYTGGCYCPYCGH